MNKKEEDLIIGLMNEDFVEAVITDHFKINNLIKLDKFHPMDFYGDNIYFETKLRRCNYKTYDTTMIGYNKLKWLKDNKVDNAYFIFVFNDGEYFYKYNPYDKFDTAIGGRNDRGKSEYKKYYYIPTNKLIKIY